MGALEQGEVVGGPGSLTRPAWLKHPDQLRAYCVVFPLPSANTNSVSFRFVPRQAGRLTLSLLGPYERVPGEKEVVYREEILWDALDLEGAALAGGSSSLLQFPVRSWLKERYDVTLSVQAGVPVTLRLSARAAQAPPPQNRELQARQTTPAHEVMKGFRRGISITQDASAGPAAGATGPADFRFIRGEGFDHVRISVAWMQHWTEKGEGEIRTEALERMDRLVAQASEAGLAVILGYQCHEALWVDPKGETPRFLRVWTQLMRHFAGSPATLAFELISPQGNRCDTLALNELYATALRELRPAAGERAILVSPGRLGHPVELARLALPMSDDRIAVSVHSRDPELFTRQKEPGTAGALAGGVRFPGPPGMPVPAQAAVQDPTARDALQAYFTLPADRNPSGPRAIQEWVRLAQAWSVSQGRPVYMADWGCRQSLEAASRARYYAAWREALDKAGMPGAAADWKGACRYWDGVAARPMPGLRNAVFPAAPESGARPPAEASLAVDAGLQQLREFRQRMTAADEESALRHQAVQALVADVKMSSENQWRTARTVLAGMLALSMLIFAASLFRRRPGVELMMAPQYATAGGMDPGLREQTVAQLAEMMREKVVERLLASRRTSEAIQQQAAAEIAEMERRLELLQTPIQERLKTYEKRITELEHDLEHMADQNRELIRTRIAMMRGKMES